MSLEECESLPATVNRCCEGTGLTIRSLTRWETDETPIPKIAELALKYIVEKSKEGRNANVLQGKSESSWPFGISVLLERAGVMGRDGWKDTAKNRTKAEGNALRISEEMERGDVRLFEMVSEWQ